LDSRRCLLERHWLGISNLVEVGTRAVGMEVVLFHFGRSFKIFPPVWSSLRGIGRHVILKPVVKVLIICVMTIFSDLLLVVRVQVGLALIVVGLGAILVVSRVLVARMEVNRVVRVNFLPVRKRLVSILWFVYSIVV